MSRSVGERIRGFARSGGEYLDVIVACGMSFVVAIIGILDVFGGDAFINEAILLVLGFYSLAVMRDRKGRQRALAQASALRCIDDAATSKQIAERRAETTNWVHRGSTGSRLRSQVIPQLVSEVDKQGGSIGLQLELADPTDAALCEAYAVQLRADSARHWTREEVRDEILTTVVALCYLRLRIPMRVRVAVSRTLSTFTVDMSDTTVLIDPMAGGAQTLVVESSLSHFRGWQRDLTASYGYARDLPLAVVETQVSDPGVIDIEELNALLVELDLLPSDYRRVDLSRLAELVGRTLPTRVHRRHPV